MQTRFLSRLITGLILASTFFPLESAVALPRFVLTASNSADGNSVHVYARDRQGLLSRRSIVSTRGKGSGDFLPNQNGLIVSGSEVLVVNAGSNDLSLMRITGSGVRFVTSVAINGVRPVSVARLGELVYVASEGDDSRAANVTGYRLSGAALEPISGAETTLSSAASGPAQIGFTPEGDALIVTERLTNTISVISVNRETGLLGSRSSFPSPGQTPWGFEFSRFGTLIISEAFEGSDSAVSSFRYTPTAGLSVLSASVDANSETDACWVTVTSNGRFAFVTNTNVGSISSYRVAQDGTLRLLKSRAARNGGLPIDLDISRDNRFLYTLNFGTGKIEAYALSGGSLRLIQEIRGPRSGNGLWVR